MTEIEKKSTDKASWLSRISLKDVIRVKNKEMYQGHARHAGKEKLKKKYALYGLTYQPDSI